MPSSPKDQGTLPELKRKFPPENDMDDWGLTTAQQVAVHFPLCVVAIIFFWCIQDAKVEEFRAILVARGAWKPSFDFHTLLRFLRAREYEVDKALSMFLDHLQWRQENRVDHILEEFEFKEREEFLSIYPQGYHKTDKKVRPAIEQRFLRQQRRAVAGTSYLYPAFGQSGYVPYSTNFHR